MSFDLQKTDIDKKIDLALTLGNMLQQDEQVKIEKFIETMSVVIQTHLIIAPNWEEVTKKAKDLEHIIQLCEPPAIAPPILQGTGAVSSLYSHRAQSQDQDSASLPKSFKSARGHREKKSKGKSKSKQQPPPPPPPPEQEEQYEDTNNYYHNENYRGNNRGCRPYRGQYSSRKPYRGEGDSKIIVEANIKVTTDNLIISKVAIIINIIAIIEVEVAMAMVGTIIDHVVTEEAITDTITIINTINMTCMMMDPSLNNMVHHVLLWRFQSFS